MVEMVSVAVLVVEMVLVVTAVVETVSVNVVLAGA
jgi:hypothetical protein